MTLTVPGIITIWLKNTSFTSKTKKETQAEKKIVTTQEKIQSPLNRERHTLCCTFKQTYLYIKTAKWLDYYIQIFIQP